MLKAESHSLQCRQGYLFVFLLVDPDNVYYSVYLIDSTFVAVADTLLVLMVMHGQWTYRVEQ